ncbi:hypothetical protein CRE_09711 [Caenorhabditis remanei]|uniref:Protein kinase domain-containing protein n=1 Tax=Caenorhabditis remanei TaxID=31234 RepID=E3N4W5_CAERE|nr:hypothetical protein CRE_09711 [Caenorhabditis remanei]
MKISRSSSNETIGTMNAQAINKDNKNGFQLNVGEKISQGTFSSTFKATIYPDRNLDFAEVAKVSLNKSPNSKYRMELKVLRQLHGNNYFPRLEFGIETKKYCYLVTEYGGESLQTVAKRNRFELLSNENVVRLFSILHNAISHLHAAGYFHRDVQASNVLLHLRDRRVHVKICDFGDSTEINAPERRRRSSILNIFNRPALPPPYHESEDHLQTAYLCLKLLLELPRIKRRNSLFAPPHISQFNLPNLEDEHDWMNLIWIRLVACYDQKSTDFEFIDTFLDRAIDGFSKESALEYSMLSGKLTLD